MQSGGAHSTYPLRGPRIPCPKLGARVTALCRWRHVAQYLRVTASQMVGRPLPEITPPDWLGTQIRRPGVSACWRLAHTTAFDRGMWTKFSPCGTYLTGCSSDCLHPCRRCAQAASAISDPERVPRTRRTPPTGSRDWLLRPRRRVAMRSAFPLLEARFPRVWFCSQFHVPFRLAWAVCPRTRAPSNNIRRTR